MAGIPIYDLGVALQKHFDAFGVASPNLVREFYPGLSLRSYSNAYHSIPRRALAHFQAMNVLVSAGFKTNKIVPLDEAMMGMGDALSLSLWSGYGVPLYGDKLDTRLLSSGMDEVDLPARARCGFLGSGAVIGDRGEVVVPCYLGSGSKSRDAYLSDLEERWFETWHTVLALPTVQDVIVIGHGMVSYQSGAMRLRKLAQVVGRGLAHARIGGGRLRALRGLRWHYVFLQFHRPPVGRILADYYGFKTMENGSIRHAAGGEIKYAPTPRDKRKWLWSSENIIQ